MPSVIRIKISMFGKSSLVSETADRFAPYISPPFTMKTTDLSGTACLETDTFAVQEFMDVVFEISKKYPQETLTLSYAATLCDGCHIIDSRVVNGEEIIDNDWFHSFLKEEELEHADEYVVPEEELCDVPLEKGESVLPF